MSIKGSNNLANYIDVILVMIHLSFRNPRIRPAIEYGCILYSGAAPTYLHHLDTLQRCVEHNYELVCISIFT